MKYEKKIIEDTKKRYEKLKKDCAESREINEKHIFEAYSNLFENLDTYKNNIMLSNMSFLKNLARKIIKSRFEKAEKNIKDCLFNITMAEKNCEVMKDFIGQLESSPDYHIGLEDVYKIVSKVDRNARLFSKPLDEILDSKEQRPAYYNIRKNLIEKLKEYSIL